MNTTRSHELSREHPTEHSTEDWWPTEHSQGAAEGECHCNKPGLLASELSVHFKAHFTTTYFTFCTKLM